MKAPILATLSAAVAMAVAGVASAAPVTSWTVTVDTIFALGATPATVTYVSATELRWGTPITTNGPQSGLIISDTPSTKTVFTDGDAVANISITHENFPIFAPSLTSVTIASTLTLVPNALGGPQVLPFLVHFLETPNDPAGGICADGTLRNDPNSLNTNGCADIFVISNDALNFPFFYDDPDFGVDPDAIQNRPYFISFFELTSGLNPLPADACAAAGVNGPCLGFRTAEAQATTVQFAAKITTVPVSIPEPGSLALLGLGLGALGLLRRRKFS